MTKEAKKTKNHLRRLFLCSCAGLALVALPVFCSMNSGKKQPTNEEVILNWLDKTRKGQYIKKDIKKAEPAAAQKTAEIVSIKEEQIREVDKTDDGWQVVTHENRVFWVPRTDAGKK